MSAYDLKIKRCCANCVHLDQPKCTIAGLKLGDCRSRLALYGPPDLRHGYCAQWYLVPMKDDDI